MIHQQENLKDVIDGLQSTENTLSSNITQLTNFYNTLNDNITALSARIAILENNLAKLEEKSITSITGTGQEIKVTPINNNTVQIGFADDAEFIAG